MFNIEKAKPADVGVSQKATDKLLSYIEEKDIPVNSLLIMKDDRLILEKYYDSFNPESLQRMYSITKSLTGIAVSILIDKGLVSYDEPITTYFPEYTTANTHPWVKATTIRNMLMMRTCHSSTTYKVNFESDWVESFFTVTPTHEPGTVFHYDTSSAHVLCRLVEKLSGKKMLDFLRENVLDHLDFSRDSYIEEDPFGVSMGGTGLMATPLDIMKILYLVDNNGSIVCSDGKIRNLINADYLRKAGSVLTETNGAGIVPFEVCGYGMQMWIHDMGGILMYGMNGQLALNVPSVKLSVVITADARNKESVRLMYMGIKEITELFKENDKR